MEQLVYRLDGADLRDRRFAFAGAGEGIRTPDPLITNQLLYLTELRQPSELFSLAYTMHPATLGSADFSIPSRSPNAPSGS